MEKNTDQNTQMMEEAIRPEGKEDNS